MATVYTGIIIFYNQEKGFGFIASEQGEIYLRRPHLQDAAIATKLKEGTSVYFSLVQGRHHKTGADQWEARNVSIAESVAITPPSDATPPATKLTIQKVGLALASDLLEQENASFSKKLIKALAYGLGIINDSKQYTRAKKLLACNQNRDGLWWGKLGAFLFEQATPSYQLRFWLDGLHDRCDSLLLENAYLKGDAAFRQRLFERCTTEQRQLLEALSIHSSPDISGGKTEAHFSNIQQIILSEILQAKRHIKIAVAWFTNQELFEALCQRVRDGLFVQIIILNDPINNWEGGINFQDFIEIGKEKDNSQLYFSTIDGPLLHHKFCLIDDEILLNGSYNWTYYAEIRNIENYLVFKNDKQLVSAFGQEFARLTQVLERVHEVVPFTATTSPKQDIHRASVYKANDLVARAKAVRNTNARLFASLLKQALVLNPENEEARAMQSQAPQRQERALQVEAIETALQEIATDQEQLRAEAVIEQAQAQQQAAEAAARAQNLLTQERKLAAEQQEREEQQRRLESEKQSLEAKNRLEKQEQEKLRLIRNREQELVAQKEKEAQRARELEAQAEQQRQAEAQRQREVQQRAAAEIRRNAEQQELAIKADALQAARNTTLKGKRGEFRINLTWNSLDDLDLHVYDPDNNHISYSVKEATCQGSIGKLDVDANAGTPTTRTPQENIFWNSKPPEGKYRVEVNNYKINELSSCPFVLTIIPDLGEPKVLAGKIVGEKRPVEVIEFIYSASTGMEIVKTI